MCVLLFALRGREFYTLIFMLVSFVVTLQFYKDWLTFQDDPLLAYSTLGIALSGVLAIYFMSREVKRMDQEEQESNAEYVQDIDGIHFSDEEVEIIHLGKRGFTYDKIIEHFKNNGRSISRDRILKVRNKFKSLAKVEE